MEKQINLLGHSKIALLATGGTKLPSPAKKNQ